MEDATGSVCIPGLTVRLFGFFQTASLLLKASFK
jgi:hypothetical protein